MLKDRGLRIHAWIFRLVGAVDCVLFALSIWPRYEGTGTEVGLADHVFGNYRFGGFRTDFAWLVVSTFCAFIAIFYFLNELRRDRRARLDALIGTGWIIAFVVYLARLLALGVLDFG